MRGGRQVVRVAGVSGRRRRRAPSRSSSPSSSNQSTICCWMSILGERPARRAQAVAAIVERPILDPVQLLGRGPMRGELRRRPARLEPLDQVAGRHDLDAARADRARSCRRPRATRRGSRSRASTPSPRAQRRRAAASARRRAAARPAYDRSSPGQCVEVVALDGVDQPARLAGRRDQVVPAPRGHVAAAGQAGQPTRIGLEPWKS